MELVIKCIVIFVLSFGFVFVRTMNVKAVASHKVISSTLWGVLVSLMWLMSIYLGVSSLIADQWVVFIPYASGGALGNVLAMLNTPEKPEPKKSECILHSPDWYGTCFNCGKQVFVRES